eukprot:scaffold3393_cov101-Isochrysis_galbana.AAC.11
MPSSERRSDAAVVVPQRTSPRMYTSGVHRRRTVSRRQASSSGRVTASSRASAEALRGGERPKTVRQAWCAKSAPMSTRHAVSPAASPAATAATRAAEIGPAESNAERLTKASILPCAGED